MGMPQAGPPPRQGPPRGAMPEAGTAPLRREGSPVGGGVPGPRPSLVGEGPGCWAPAVVGSQQLGTEK